MRKSQITIFMILGIVTLILFSLALYVQTLVEERRGEEAVQRALKRPDIEATPQNTCIDGTAYSTCAAEPPLYCKRPGLLVFDCQTCGCPKSQTCSADGNCTTPEPAKEGVVTYFVPMNYAPDDIDFINRAELFKATLQLATPMKDENFFTVPERMDFNTGDCENAMPALQNFVTTWAGKQGKPLPAVKLTGSVPVYSYRIIGIDKNVQNEAACGCAHTKVYSPTVYVGGSPCSKAVHVALHELGHTFGLCDEYDTCVWDETSAWLQQNHGHACLNARPGAVNSDCGQRCCAKDVACCNGKYANVQSDNAFNVMGSADTPPRRRLSTETSAVVGTFLCTNLEVCA
ncbi:hypothetical protein HY642_06375 [Candidatus Woesearchaeota archaeon]|nr:hypothetical protein [Candidatus Woesearchaeota archaeon]